MSNLTAPPDAPDELLAQAARFVIAEQHATSGLLERRFRIGHRRACDLLVDLENHGIVGPQNGQGHRRQVLVDRSHAADAIASLVGNAGEWP